jgi:hypothetical protein
MKKGLPLLFLLTSLSAVACVAEPVEIDEEVPSEVEIREVYESQALCNTSYECRGTSCAGSPRLYKVVCCHDPSNTNDGGLITCNFYSTNICC